MAERIHNKSQYGGYDNAVQIDRLYAYWLPLANYAESQNWNDEDANAELDKAWDAYKSTELAYRVEVEGIARRDRLCGSRFRSRESHPR